MLRILLYALLFYMIFRIVALNAINRKNKGLIGIVNSIGQKEEFFTRINEVIETSQDPVYASKARVLKLWGMSYHDEYFGFDKTLEELEIDPLLKTNKDGSTGIGQEDSLFYMYLGIPNLLYMNKQDDYRKALQEKMAPYGQKLDKEIVKALGDSCDMYYDSVGDKGMSFYNCLLEGEYQDYTYARSLIGLYKSIAETMLARIYKDQGNEEKFTETLDGLRVFITSGIGARWIKAMELTEYVEQKEEEPSDEQPEEEPADTEEDEKKEDAE